MQQERKRKNQQLKNIKHEPVSLPSPEGLEKMRMDRKVMQSYKVQSILYGVDILSSEISTFYQTQEMFKMHQKDRISGNKVLTTDNRNKE